MIALRHSPNRDKRGYQAHHVSGAGGIFPADGSRSWASLKVGLPVGLRYLQNSYAVNAAFGGAARAEAEAWMTEIVAIQKRMKQLGM
jgi:hypothetical protein